MTEIKVNKDAPRQVVRMLVDNQPNVLAPACLAEEILTSAPLPHQKPTFQGLPELQSLLGKMMKMYCIRSLPRQKNWKWCGKSICWI